MQNIIYIAVLHTLHFQYYHFAKSVWQTSVWLHHCSLFAIKMDCLPFRHSARPLLTVQINHDMQGSRRKAYHLTLQRWSHTLAPFSVCIKCLYKMKIIPEHRKESCKSLRDINTGLTFGWLHQFDRTGPWACRDSTLSKTDPLIHQITCLPAL